MNSYEFTEASSHVSSSPHQPLALLLWERPPHDTIKINCDASFEASSRSASIAAIARDCNERLVDGANALVRTKFSASG
ncbi:hypothetical protein REPUB_Repub06bG0115100 [Reevesia pubescens]